MTYRLTDNDLIVVNGIITQCTYDIATKGNINKIPETLDGHTIIVLGDNCFSVAANQCEFNKVKLIFSVGFYQNFKISIITYDGRKKLSFILRISNSQYINL